MTPDQIAIVQRSFAAVVPRADAVARTFYDRLFAAEPALRTLFAADMREQRSKLMLTLGTVAQRLHAIETILPTVRALAHRHVGYGAEPRHYGLVGAALLDALAAHVPGFGAAERGAWAAAYAVLAGEMLRTAGKDRAAA